jgi:uncharacterized DUF497 family protein
MEFDWDGGNRSKAQRHGVVPAEIEHAMQTGLRVAPDAAHSLSEQRFIAIGRTSTGRHIFVAFCWRNGKVRPISARYMHEREIARYDSAQGPGDDDR